MSKNIKAIILIILGILLFFIWMFASAIGGFNPQIDILIFSACLLFYGLYDIFRNKNKVARSSAEVNRGLLKAVVRGLIIGVIISALMYLLLR